jgi:signal transduction histidine kinase
MFMHGVTRGQVIDSRFVYDTNITPHVAVLKTEAPVDIDSVLTFQSQIRFETAPAKVVVFSGYDKYYYWFKMIISNDDSIPRPLMLLLPPVGMREGELFQKDMGRWKVSCRNGYALDFDTRPYPYAGYVFPFTVPPNTIDTLYLSMDASHAFKSYGFVLMKPKVLRMMENRVYLFFGVIVGILALFCLFNLYLWFMLKDKIHLWYSLHIALLILIVLKHDQLDQQFLNWDSEMAYTMTSIMAIAAFSIGILMHVILHFLSHIHENHILHKITLLAKWNIFISGACQLIVFYFQMDHQIQSVVYHWCNKSTLFGIAVIIIDCIGNIRKEKRSAFFLIAVLLFLLGAIYRLLLIGSNAYYQPPHLFHYGMVMETFVITFGLIYQYRVARMQKDQFIKEKEMLQNSRHKLLLESKLEIQEQTLRTTFKEINTNIGDKITTVKENILGLRAADTDTACRYLNESKTLLTKAISELRNICKILDTDYVRDLGLLKSIEYELDQCKKSGACNTILQIQGEPFKLDRQKELILFRMYQELLNEINKYYPGGSIVVQLNYEYAALRLIILLAESRILPSEVLHIRSNGDFQKRAMLIGGTFVIEWSETHTKMIISLPTPTVD